MKPYSESCDQNRDPILEVIEPLLKHTTSVLEIGSGTGQHAVYFAKRMPHLIWHTSDRKENHEGIRNWLIEEQLSNTREPLTLDVSQPKWPEIEVDAIFSANTTHIMHAENVVDLFAGIGGLLVNHGLFILYGPFNYGNRYTSDSNQRFDQWLKQRDPKSGIRNFEDLDKLANNASMALKHDFAMPANNRILVWQHSIST